MDTSCFPKYFPYIACFRYQVSNLLFPEYPWIIPIIYYPVFPAICTADDLGKFFFNQIFDLTGQIKIHQTAVDFLIIRSQYQSATVAHHRRMNPQFFPDWTHSFRHTG